MASLSSANIVVCSGLPYLLHIARIFFVSTRWGALYMREPMRLCWDGIGRRHFADCWGTDERGKNTWVTEPAKQEHAVPADNTRKPDLTLPARQHRTGCEAGRIRREGEVGEGWSHAGFTMCAQTSCDSTMLISLNDSRHFRAQENAPQVNPVLLAAREALVVVQWEHKLS